MEQTGHPIFFFFQSLYFICFTKSGVLFIYILYSKKVRFTGGYWPLIAHSWVLTFASPFGNTFCDLASRFASWNEDVETITQIERKKRKEKKEVMLTAYSGRSSTGFSIHIVIDSIRKSLFKFKLIQDMFSQTLWTKSMGKRDELYPNGPLGFSIAVQLIDPMLTGFGFLVRQLIGLKLILVQALWIVSV